MGPFSIYLGRENFVHRVLMPNLLRFEPFLQKYQTHLPILRFLSCPILLDITRVEEIDNVGLSSIQAFNLSVDLLLAKIAVASLSITPESSVCQVGVGDVHFS